MAEELINLPSSVQIDTFGKDSPTIPLRSISGAKNSSFKNKLFKRPLSIEKKSLINRRNVQHLMSTRSK